jgi:uncharacterized coiled-coil protein SlyX
MNKEDMKNRIEYLESKCGEFEEELNKTKAKHQKFIDEENIFLNEIKKCLECEGCRRIIDKRIKELSQQAVEE